jgi:predicted DNA-binding transcriptional regulator YafY
MRELLDTEPWETGTETPLRARVWFAPDLAWWAARQVDELERHADGSVVATLEVSNQEAFIGWVLNFGASAEVLEPQTLRRALVDRVRGVA